MNSSNKIITEFESKYGFLLNLINKNNTVNIQNDLYRVRIANKSENILETEQLSYPKTNVSSGRCNFENNPIFYCSDKSTTAISETLKYTNPSNKHLFLSVWRLKPDKDINIFPLINKAKQKGLLKDIDPLSIITDETKRNISRKQLLEIEKYFYDADHSKSASICHILFKRKILPCDCIFYPSIIDSETGINISLKTDFVDKSLAFQRAYKFELFGGPENYKMKLLKYTLSKNKFKWLPPNPEQILFRALTEKDLGL
ncbi:RES domain-containing protein [Gilvimarinus agarilyticus]|uniref:RES domain-containing protein n=1 Tax=Reichenbachiella agariperforans TaxID=156994 RepID=UPI001C096333|nr:RES domain-containing protein [Reichenbachiella agariperforans]MBU2884174.1 RES domain-containing protein [Gilvimarinus agarilyticus]MBU2912802.1 RES domain-containing protein [Reichenbachiella agariperforans]